MSLGTDGLVGRDPGFNFGVEKRGSRGFSTFCGRTKFEGKGTSEELLGFCKLRSKTSDIHRDGPLELDPWEPSVVKGLVGTN